MIRRNSGTSYDRYAPYRAYQNQGSLINFNTYQPEFIGRPVEDIRNMVQLQSSNNKAIVDNASATSLALSNLNLNAADEQHRIKQQQDFNQGIKDLGNNDYGMIGANVSKMARDFQTNKALQYSAANQALFESNRLKEEELYYKDLRSDAQFKDALAQEFTPTTEISNGIYSKFIPNQYVNKYDYDTDFANYAKQFTITENRTGFEPIGTDGQSGYKQTTRKFYNKKLLREQLINLPETNPDMKAFMEEEARLNGKDYKTFVEEEAEKYVQLKAGRSDLDNTTLWKPVATDANPNGFNIDYYGMSSLIRQDYSDITKAFTKSTSNDSLWGGPGKVTYDDGVQEGNGASPYNIQFTPERLIEVNNMAHTVGGMEGMLDGDNKQITDINKLNNEQQDIVFGNIKRFINILEENKGADGTANISYMKAVDTKTEQERYNWKLTGNKDGIIKDSNNKIRPGIISSNKFGKYVDYETRTPVNMEKLLNDLPKDSRISVLGVTNFTNPISSIVKDYNFGKSLIIQIGDKIVYMAMPSGTARISPETEKAKMYASFYDGLKTKDITIGGVPHQITYDEVNKGFVIKDDNALLDKEDNNYLFRSIDKLYEYYLANQNKN